MSRCCCHSFTVSLLLLNSRQIEKKKIITLFWIKNKFGFFVCCEGVCNSDPTTDKKKNKKKKRQLKKNGDVPLHILELQA